jgi:hypothetical protein
VQAGTRVGAHLIGTLLGGGEPSPIYWPRLANLAASGARNDIRSYWLVLSGTLPQRLVICDKWCATCIG